MKQKRITQTILSNNSQALQKYFNEINNIKLLTPEEEVELAIKIHEGDKDAFEKMVAANLRFVVSIAKQYQFCGVAVYDLISAGNIGLQEAVKDFDETRGFRLDTFAGPYIRRYVLEELKKNGRTIRLPDKKNTLSHKIKNESANFEQVYERKPTIKELAYILNEDENTIISVLNASTQTVSFDSPSTSSKVNEDFTIADTYADNDVDIEKEAQISFIRDEINRALPNLSPLEQAVIRGSFGIGCDMMTIEEIADDLGISIHDVQKSKNNAIARLREKCDHLSVYWDL